MNAICIEVAEAAQQPREDVINDWFRKVHGIDGQFAQAIWQLYFDQLVKLARVQLGSLPPAEGKLAGSALVSFVRGTQAGRFPQLTDHHDLWRLLVSITVRRVAARSYPANRLQKAFGSSNIDADVLQEILSDGPSETLAGELLDTCSEMLQSLRDPALKVLALFKMESYTNLEIATILGCSARTVQRRLERIRDIWQEREEIGSFSW